MEVNEGLLAFFAEEEGAVGGVSGGSAAAGGCHRRGAGIFCALACGVGVRGPWRVSLTSGERSGQEDEESLLRGKLEWKSRRRGSAPEDGTKASERSFSVANWL